MKRARKCHETEDLKRHGCIGKLENLPRKIPMKKSAAAKLQTKNLGTSILFLEKTRTKTTVPFPSIDNRKTTQTPQRSVHQSNKSWQGRKGPENMCRIRSLMYMLTTNLNGNPIGYLVGVGTECAVGPEAKTGAPIVLPHFDHLGPRNIRLRRMAGFRGRQSPIRNCAKGRLSSSQICRSSCLQVNNY